MHDELTVMNYICYYDRLSDKQKQKLNAIDIKTVKQYCLTS